MTKFFLLFSDILTIILRGHTTVGGSVRGVPTEKKLRFWDKFELVLYCTNAETVFEHQVFILDLVSWHTIHVRLPREG